ncbi:tRNA (guanosine(18)-2'-O)-methyltransferase [compost metagenome]
MGSILRINIAYIDKYDFENTINLLKQNQFKIIGTSLKTDKYVKNIDFKTQKNCFVVGNEANGISENVLAQCDELVKIPMKCTAESLNVSIAAAIMLYEQYND